jgi:hypothetical protein
MMPKGKGFAVFEVDSEKKIGYASHTGGMVKNKSVDRPHPELPDTMVVEPTGGTEWQPLEVEFAESDLVEELGGTSFMDLWQFFWDWHNQLDQDRYKSTAATWYKDTQFSDVDKSFSYQKCWASEVTIPEGERGSSDARTFKVTITHQGFAE